MAKCLKACWAAQETSPYRKFFTKSVYSTSEGMISGKGAVEIDQPEPGIALPPVKLLEAGMPINAARVGLRAHFGLPLPEMFRVRVGICSSVPFAGTCGDPGADRAVNGPMLSCLARNLGAEPELYSGFSAQSEDLMTYLARQDLPPILLISAGLCTNHGGVMADTLQTLKAKLLFHQDCLRLGKPILAALLGEKLLLCLPQRPVEAYLNALLFLPVALACLEGFPVPDLWQDGYLVESIPASAIRPSLQPCRREKERLFPLACQGPVDLLQLAKADVCAWIPELGCKPGWVRYLEII